MEPLIGTTAAFTILIRVWQLVAKRCLARGWPAPLAHLLAGPTGLLAGFIALGIAALAGAVWVAPPAILLVARPATKRAREWLEALRANGSPSVDTPLSAASTVNVFLGGDQRAIDAAKQAAQHRRVKKKSKRDYLPRSWFRASYDSLDEWKSDVTTVWAGIAQSAEFTYTNRRGETKRRRVDVDEVLRDRNGNLFISGFCHARREPRTFRVSGIKSLSATGRRPTDVYLWLDEITGGAI